MNKQIQIKCPHCEKSVDVSNAIYSTLQAELENKYRDEVQEEKKKFEDQQIVLQKARLELEAERTSLEEKISEAVRVKLKTEKEVLEKTLREKLAEEESGRWKTLQDELNEKSEKLKELNQTKAEVERLKRLGEEMKESMQAEAEKALTEKLAEEREKIRRSEQEKNELVIKEYQLKLEEQKKLTEEMKRRQEQGSMQLQGEVLELAIEEWLRTGYPLDTIEEIKKGIAGADCIQHVNTRTRQNCGKIYYESKRAKNFDNGWIDKFKADMRAKGINIGILVTQSMPRDMERMGFKDGIWICSYEEFKGLSAALRQSIIMISDASASQENKGDKMNMLYDFLTSPEFMAQIEAIVEGFSRMKTDLESEKRAMERLWKTREKQLEKVIINTSHMYGSIKGIAGAAIGTVKSLELGGGEMEDTDAQDETMLE